MSAFTIITLLTSQSRRQSFPPDDNKNAPKGCFILALVLLLATCIFLILYNHKPRKMQNPKPSTVLIIEPKKGRKVRDHATGQVYEYNGIKWIKHNIYAQNIITTPSNN